VLKEKTFIFARISQLIDAGLTALAYWLAFFSWWLLHQLQFDLFLFGWRILPLYQHFTTNFNQYSYLLFFIVPFFPIILELNGMYGSIGFKSRSEIARTIARSIILGLFIIFGLIFFLQYRNISRPLLFGFGVISFILIYIKEMVILEYIEFTRESGRNYKYIIVVGVGEIARKAIALIEQHPKWAFKVKGCVVPPHMKDEKEVIGQTSLGIYDDMAEILRVHQPDMVIFAVDKRYIAEAEVAIYSCETQGVETWMIPDYFDIKIAKVNFENFFNLPVILYRTTPEYSWQILIKGVFDRVFGLVLLILSLPFFIVVPILIKATSRGPILFRQKRNGIRGKEFTMYKFRTMVAGAAAMKQDLQQYNEMDGAAFKMTNDPRVTRLGHWLRKLSIDELPQLFNVLSGSMSIVGPRPLAQYEVDKFKIWQRRRLSMKPGLTCLWQIQGRNEVRFEDWMKLDLEYIDNWSLWMDVRILFMTIPVVLLGKGAK